jgi:gliding motility-associated-like protein
VDLGEDKEVQLGESVPLLAAINFSEQEIAQIVWRSSDGVPPCSDCLEAEITPLETVQIDIRITDNFGCTTLDQLLLTVQKPEALFVPNGFSPDGDGLNDRLVVYAGKDVERIGLFRILDRWGDQVFQATDFLPNDPAVSWDGTFRGQALKAGVFVYVIEVVYIDGKRKVYSGDINLIR